MVGAMNNERERQIFAQRFGLFIGLATIVMLFVAMTSALIVRQGAGNWVNINLPYQFWISTAIILLSSVTMFISKKAHKQMEVQRFRIFFWATFILGVAFIINQWLGYFALAKSGFYINGINSYQYVYVISMTHLAHVGVGLLILLYTGIKTSVQKFNPNYHHIIGFISVYWHFVDLLWIFLFIFFQLKFF
ncbi:MAG TPA: cytochrome oxidase subunit III [Bacteroidetes bacterium]|nr:cytochrome oxidase subunit III [Bacteroidota bacterium]